MHIHEAYFGEQAASSEHSSVSNMATVIAEGLHDPLFFLAILYGFILGTSAVEGKYTF